MDGNKHKAVIQSWFNSVIKDGGIERHDDLHVDQIDAAWKPQSSWVAAALESFEIAVEIRNAYENNSNLNILLSIPLESEMEPLGITFHCREDLEKNLSYIPPSLYVLRSDAKIIRRVRAAEEGGASRDANLKLLNGAEYFGEISRSVKCLYSENKRPKDDEYSRYIYLVA